MEIVNEIFDRIFSHPGFDLLLKVIAGYGAVFALMAAGYLIHWLPEAWKVRYRQWFASQPLWLMGIITVFAIFLMYQLMSGEMQPFIYFQF